MASANYPRRLPLNRHSHPKTANIGPTRVSEDPQSTIPMNLDEGIRFLAKGGLNLVAVLDGAALPGQTKQLIVRSRIPLNDYKRLMVIGHGGRRLWEALEARGTMCADPVDDYSVSLTGQFIRDYLGSPAVFWLYPNTKYLVPLQQLGEAAGWSFPSPLGSGVSPEYGAWFAYRTAFLIDADLPLRREAPASSPCDSCKKKPCIRACPADAVQWADFDIDSCVQHRLRPESPCADRCLARLACPLSPEHRYTRSQIQYHYRRSLETIRAWHGG
jgi:epoxyqueuosine reductase